MGKILPRYQPGHLCGYDDCREVLGPSCYGESCPYMNKDDRKGSQGAQWGYLHIQIQYIIITYTPWIFVTYTNSPFCLFLSLATDSNDQCMPPMLRRDHSPNTCFLRQASLLRHRFLESKEWPPPTGSTARGGSVGSRNKCH